MAEVVDQQNTTSDGGYGTVGDSGGTEYRTAQSFKLSANLTVTAVEVMCNAVSGSPTGNWTLRIETDSSGVPSGTLANANASKVVTPPTAGNTVKGSFATSFQLTGATSYWLVIQCNNQSNNYNWVMQGNGSSSYADGCLAQSGSGTWTAYSTLELWFKVYVLEPILRSFSDSLVPVDVFEKSPARTFVEVIKSVDLTLGKLIGKVFLETAKLSDLTRRAFTRIYSDIPKLGDILIKSPARLLSDILKSVELGIVRGLGKNFLEPIKLSDNIKRAFTRICSEIITLVEVAAKNISIFFTDIAIKLSDSLSRIGSIKRTFTETFLIAEDILTKTLKWLHTTHIDSTWDKLTRVTSTWAKNTKSNSVWTKKYE